MEFGRLADVSQVNFELPTDAFHAASILGTPVVTPKWYIGCAKWGRVDWVGKLYPQGTKEKDFLQHYVKYFNCIELNATHYRIFDKHVVMKWRDTAPDGFLYCPKFYNGISHVRRLKNCTDLTHAYFDSIFTLEDKLGPSFLQLHENFGPKDLEIVKAYLSSLPADLNVVLELRHPKWFEQNLKIDHFVEFLEKRRIGWVITDAAGRRDCLHMRLTRNDVFIRFVGNSLHASDYERVRAWSHRLHQWIQQGLSTVYFFMHQHDELYSPELISYMIQYLNQTYGYQIPEVRLINSNTQQNGTLFG